MSRPDRAAEENGDRIDRPFDDGLQPERTALAWRRTGLALTAGSLAATRILPEVLGPWVAVPAGFGIAAAVFILIVAHLRYRTVHAALTSSRSAEIPLHGGGLPALVTGLTVAGGVGALIGAIAVALT